MNELTLFLIELTIYVCLDPWNGISKLLHSFIVAITMTTATMTKSQKITIPSYFFPFIPSNSILNAKGNTNIHKIIPQIIVTGLTDSRIS